MLGLTIPQAAATLAATVVGFNIGLFDQSVVNAVLVLILVSIVAATLTVERVKARVPVPDIKGRGIGKHVLVASRIPARRRSDLRSARASPAQTVGSSAACSVALPRPSQHVESELAQLRSVGYAYGVDTDPALLVHSSFAEGIVNASVEHEPSFVLVGQSRRSVGVLYLTVPAEAVAASISDPVALFIGEVEKIRGVVLAVPGAIGDEPPSDTARIATEVASRLGGKNVTVVHQDPGAAFADLAPGQVGVTVIDSADILGTVDPPAGAGIVIVLQG